MRLLDLFCGAGGAAVGYHRAGFDEIVGVDIEPQPNYPFEFVQADAMTYPLDGFDLIHASPPCQAFSWSASRWKREHPELVASTRDRLLASSTPYIIENVIGAPLLGPTMLCGLMFNLNVLRHRLFESSEVLLPPGHQSHAPPIWRDDLNDGSHRVRRSAYVTVAGQGGQSASYKFADWKEAMGIDWMTKKELTQAIPPAYTEYLGAQILSPLTARML